MTARINATINRVRGFRELSHAFGYYQAARLVIEVHGDRKRRGQ